MRIARSYAAGGRPPRHETRDSLALLTSRILDSQDWVEGWCDIAVLHDLAASEGRQLSPKGLLYLQSSSQPDRDHIHDAKRIAKALATWGFSILHGAEHKTADLVRTVATANVVVTTDHPEASLLALLRPEAKVVLIGPRGGFLALPFDLQESGRLVHLPGHRVGPRDLVVGIDDLAQALGGRRASPHGQPPLILEPAPAFRHSGPGTASEHLFLADESRGEVLPVHTRIEVSERSRTLIVALHGGVEPAPARLPHFEWGRTLSARDESKLFISDPTLTVSPHLLNGWYFGLPHDDVIPRLAALVEAAMRDVAAEHCVLVGSSAGGVAAMQLAARIPGAVAIGYSLQRSLAFGPRHHVRSFFEHVLPECSLYEQAHDAHGSRVALEDAFQADGYAGHAVWIQNTGDAEHMRDHYVPLSKSLGHDSTPAAVELVPGRLHGVATYWGAGHPVPPPSLFQAALDAGISYARTGTWLGLPWKAQVPPPSDAFVLDSDLAAPEVVDLSKFAQPQKAGFIKFEGTATPGSCVAIRIGDHWYQAVSVEEGRWSIDQSFAPAKHWAVGLYTFVPEEQRISTPLRIPLSVVRH